VLAQAARTLAGAVLLLVGAALLVLPGPGLLVIAAGLAVLAIDYRWPRQLLVRVRDQLTTTRRRLAARGNQRT
jgi:Putative transmembrane protein (PGPGW)